MQIERIEELRLTPSNDQAIADLLALCFETDFGGRSYFMQRHHVRFVARENGKIIGHIGLTFRSIRMGQTLTPVIGVADVATHPDWQGKRIAATLLDSAIAEAGQSLAHFMLLFGDAGIYARAGFRKADNKMTYVALDGARTGSVQTAQSDVLMVLPTGTRDWDGDCDLDLLGHLF